MKSNDIEAIMSFIDTEIKGRDLTYDYYVEDSEFKAVFTGRFTSGQEVEMDFKCVGETMQVYSLCESYIVLDTREFWIEFMSRFSR